MSIVMLRYYLFQLGHNPITAPMSTIMLTRFLKAKESNLKELDLEVLLLYTFGLTSLKSLHILFFVICKNIGQPAVSDKTFQYNTFERRCSDVTTSQ